MIKNLRALFIQAVADGNESAIDELEKKLNKRNRAAIFKAGCKCLRLPKGWNNQFAYAAHFADQAINDENYFCDDDYYEISGFYTKSKNPVVIYFD